MVAEETNCIIMIVIASKNKRIAPVIFPLTKKEREKNAYEFYQQLSPSLIYSATFSKWKSFFTFFLLLCWSFQWNFVLLLQNDAIAPFVHVHEEFDLVCIAKVVSVCIYCMRGGGGGRSTKFIHFHSLSHCCCLLPRWLVYFCSLL